MIESSITIAVAVAPEMMSSSCAGPPASAFAARSRPASDSVSARILASGTPISAIGSACSTSFAPVITASGETADIRWI